MSKFLNERYRSLMPYTPGEQPQDKRYIKLNTNESPYPPSPCVLRAVSVDEVAKLRLYSDPEVKDLTRALAANFGVKETEVLATNGSDEALAFIFMAYGDRGMAYADITYGFYTVYAAFMGVGEKIIPLKDDFSIDVNEYIGLKENIIIANPNAPTGIALPLSDIEKVIAANPESVVVVDEAYVDFGAESAVDLIRKYDNLIVVQTMSKSRSLAGGRLGFLIACEDIIADLKKIKYSFHPYNVNRLTAIAGKAAVEDREYFVSCTTKIADTREKTVVELEKRGFEVLPSKANFIFARSKKMDGEKLYLTLKSEGVLVRFFNKPRLKDYVRITIGSPEEMEILLEKLDKIGA